MKIDDHVTINGINSIVQVEKVAGKEDGVRQTGNARSPEPDRVELATRKSEIEKLAKAVEAMPDVRTEKVEALTRQIGEGNYRVDGARVAEKMLERLKGEGNSGGAQ